MPFSPFVVAVLGLDAARDQIPRVAYVVAMGLLGLSVIAFIGYIVYRSTLNQPQPTTTEVIVEAISSLLLVAFVAFAVRWRTARRGRDLIVSIVAGMLGLVLLVGSAVRTSDRVADVVAIGGIGTVSTLGGGLTAFRVEAVTVLNATGDEDRLKPAFNDCATLFGVKNGVIILLRPHYEDGAPLVMRLPIEEFAIQRGCPVV